MHKFRLFIYLFYTKRTQNSMDKYLIFRRASYSTTNLIQIHRNITFETQFYVNIIRRDVQINDRKWLSQNGVKYRISSVVCENP